MFKHSVVVPEGALCISSLVTWVRQLGNYFHDVFASHKDFNLCSGEFESNLLDRLVRATGHNLEVRARFEARSWQADSGLRIWSDKIFATLIMLLIADTRVAPDCLVLHGVTTVNLATRALFRAIQSVIYLLSANYQGFQFFFNGSLVDCDVPRGACIRFHHSFL